MDLSRQQDIYGSESRRKDEISIWNVVGKDKYFYGTFA